MKEICIFGAGKIGILAMEYMKQNLEYEQYYFCDNDNEKTGVLVYGHEVISFKKLKEKFICGQIDVYIAILEGMQNVYEQCQNENIKINGVYSVKQNKMVSYKEFCIEMCTFYGNDAYVHYKISKQKIVLENIKKFLNGSLLSTCISEITLELSNLCNYANIHKRCPASLICEGEKEIIPFFRIEEIVLQLADMSFEGIICFHIYNEPMIDPRLFLIIQFIKNKLKNIKILIYTNGYYLNQTMAEELQNGFADIVVATGYGKNNFTQLVNLDFHIPYCVLFGNLDEQIEMKNGTKKNCVMNCSSLLNQVPIFTNGDIGLCCMDYEHKNGFGNVFYHSLKEILNCPYTRKIQEELLKGNRKVTEYCQKCDWTGFSI